MILGALWTHVCRHQAQNPNWKADSELVQSLPQLLILYSSHYAIKESQDLQTKDISQNSDSTKYHESQ